MTTKKDKIIKNIKSADLDWLDKLVQDLEQTLEQGKVVIRERNLYEEELVGPDPFYDVIIIYPKFENLEYDERINMIWPIFAKLPEKYFKKIIGVDCVTPAEYHRKVA